MKAKEDVVNWILKLAVGSLAMMVLAMVFALIAGLFMPNDVVDNKDIFPIIGPAFNTVIGAFVGLLGGLSMSQKSASDDKEEKKDEENKEE
jgi:mannitol-specific phosphotransferase system IIBC component